MPQTFNFNDGSLASAPASSGALTLRKLVDFCELSLGGSPDPRIDPVEIVNEAGRHLYGLHSWRWRLRPPVDLDFVANQPYVALPGDFGFGELESLVMRDGSGITLTTLEMIEHLRSTSAGCGYHAAVAYPTQASPSQTPTSARLEIAPIPTANLAAAMRAVYRSGWVPLSLPGDVANVPTSFDNLLRRLVAAFAIATSTGDYSKVEEASQSTQVRDLKRMDGAAQANLGPMRGGILSGRVGRAGYQWNFRTVGP